jgi:hypothetical protein
MFLGEAYNASISYNKDRAGNKAKFDEVCGSVKRLIKCKH